VSPEQLPAVHKENVNESPGHRKMASLTVLTVALLVAEALNGLKAFGIETGLLVGANVGVKVGPVGDIVGRVVGLNELGADVGPPANRQDPSFLGICKREVVVPAGSPLILLGTESHKRAVRI